MYDRSHRFPKLSTSTPDRVGPGTYNTARTIGKDGSKCAPFLSSQPRNTFLGSKACLYQPGPTSYNPCTKEHPKGFISMDKGAPRFIYIQDGLPPVEDLEKEEVDNISEKLLAKPSYTGKMLSGVMLNEQNTPVPSIPRKRGEKQFIFTYDENTERYLLQSLLQTTNENQKGQVFHDSLKFKRYKGVYFGNRTEPRDDSLPRRSEGPGPTDYNVLSKTWEVPVSYTGKKWLAIHHTKDGKDYITLILKPEKLSDTVNPVKEISFMKGYRPVHLKSVPMRYFDLLMRNAATEDIPSPNYYNIIKDLPSSANKSKAREEKYRESTFSDNIQRKLSFRRLNVQHGTPKHGFNSSCLRFITKTSETPGPGEYEISLHKYPLNVGEDPNSAFLHRAPRFQDYNDNTPGPGSYECFGMTDELKNHSRPSCYLPVNWQAPPFGSFVPRSISLSASEDTPGPGSYNIQDLWTRKHKIMDAVFKYQNESCVSPQYSTRAPLINAADLQRGMMTKLHRSRSDLASRLTCKAISVQSESKAQKKRRPTDRKQSKMVSRYPLNTTAPRVENLRIPNYPGPGKYSYADNIPALNVGYSGRMTSLTERFKKSEDSPGPADYQKVKPEMIRKSFNVSIESGAKRDVMANQVKRKRKKTAKKEAAATSKFDNTIAICERNGRVLIMKKPYKAPLQVKGKGRHVFLPSNVRTSMRLSF